MIGGTATELASVVTGSHFGAFEHQAILFAIASTILTPVCLLPSLAPLAFASVLGVLGMCLLAGVMVLRMFDGSYLPGGEFHRRVDIKVPRHFLMAGVSSRFGRNPFDTCIDTTSPPLAARSAF